MTNSVQCVDCGAPLPSGQPKGLCARCAIHGALELGEPAKVISENLPGGLPRSFGDYDLLEEIARGGMGVVFKARQRNLGRIVAVKMLPLNQAASADRIRRFKAEAVAAASLQHPNIVAVHETGEHEGQHYIVMDYVEGPNLAQFSKGQPMPGKVAAQFLKTISEAVDYAHERRILHRDLKPSNVLIDLQNQPRVTDFGLAKGLGDFPLTETTDDQHASVLLYQSLTGDGHVLGSPGYMPPEQAAGNKREVGRYSDVYSLGAMLYHLLTGRPPFGGGSLADTLLQVQKQDPLSPRLLNPSVPRDLQTICLKCLEKEPSRRYATARALAEELHRFLIGEPIQARPVGPPERVWRWGRRNPLATGFVGVLCAALVSLFSLLHRVNEEKIKHEVLAGVLQGTIRDYNKLFKNSLIMIEEGLEHIWSNKEQKMMVLDADHVAALAQMPIRPAPTASTVLTLSLGITVEERPAGRARQHALLLDELQTRLSHALGTPVRFKLHLYKFQDDLVADLRDAKVDFSRLGALRFLRTRRSDQELVPLVVPVATNKIGLLFTRPDTGIRSLADVRGRTVAFGDTNATVSYWAQIKLAEIGIGATNLAAYEFLDSTQDFAEDVQEFGLAQTVGHIGFLHSHAQVIEGVLSGRYDVGVAVKRAFDSHSHRGLVAIPGTEFKSSRTLLTARGNLDPAIVRAMIKVLTEFEGRWLEALPEQSPGFRAVTAGDFAIEEQWFDRIAATFPPKPSPPRIPIPELRRSK